MAREKAADKSQENAGQDPVNASDKQALENEPGTTGAEQTEAAPAEGAPEVLEQNQTPDPDVSPDAEANAKDGSAADLEGSSEELESSNVGSAGTPNPENVEPKLTVVIPYLKARAQGKELLYAIRSLAKHFKEDFQLLVIGDREDWFSDEVVFIDHACIGSNPQADVIDKMKQILMDERVSEGFVWSNDDIYFVSPTTLEDIQVLKMDGNLVNSSSNPGLYNKNRTRTIEVLEKLSKPIRNFGTHTPFFFEKEKMMEVFESVQEMESEGLLMASVYHNYHFDPSIPVEKCNWRTDKWALRVISKLETEEKKQLFRSLIGGKHFLNHSEEGYSDLLMDWIQRQFPEKCRFEK